MDRRPAIGRAAKDLAKQLGMKVGLYLDVAVGVQADGFDAWNEQVAISRHLGVGAPPDPLNTAGQSWGLAGFNAAGPRATVLRAVSATCCAPRCATPARSGSTTCSGLKRLYLVPHGFPARRRRLCADAVRGAAGRDRAGKRRATVAS